MTNAVSLSIAIITLNEAKNIQRCIESVLAVADEIVVVDSLSTDNTKDIAVSYAKVKFIEQPFLGYIEQKNFALEATSGTHVLCLDADEVLSDTLLAAIEEQKKLQFPFDAYSMNRCTCIGNYWVRRGAWYPDVKLRLFKKGLGKWGGTNPHDKIELLHSSKVKHLNGDLLHYSYHNFEEVIHQNNRFTTIQAVAMYKQGKKSNVFKLIVNPPVAFLSSYILKLGFLDGLIGLFVAKSVAYQTFMKYAKLMELQKTSTDTTNQ